ncbi:3,4-dihydroxy-2-butanone-4-phosphate synthase [Cupriavidus basilensis]
MAAHARGLVCLAITESRRRRLSLPMMAGGDRQREPFTVSIEAVEGVSTGISAADRALTMRVASAAHASAGHLVQPGHVFPIVAQPDGVLRRAGFAEACSDLPRLAGREAAGAYTVLLDDAGELLRGAALLAFAREHGLMVCADQRPDPSSPAGGGRGAPQPEQPAGHALRRVRRACVLRRAHRRRAPGAGAGPA